MADRVRAEETPATEPTQDIFVYYLGRRDVEGGPGYAVIPVRIFESDMTMEELAERTSIFTASRKAQMPEAIGAVYRCKGALHENGRLKQASMHFDPVPEERLMPSKSLRAGCQARDKAAMIAVRARKTHEALKRDNQLGDLLRPLKLRWNETDSIGRAALEVAVLHELRRGV